MVFLEPLLARIHARRIEDRLLAGALPEDSGENQARCKQVLAPGNRAAVADALRQTVAAADRGGRFLLASRIPLKDDEVRGSRQLILDLADEVESDATVSPRGVILADRLIRDGDSALYWRSDLDVRHADETVDGAVRHASAALHPG
jgi:hypothetical protein